MSKKNKKQARQGTYALCIAMGMMLGLGFGPALGNTWLSILGGLILGALAGYGFTRNQSVKKH